jgi:hypothetical protein
MQLGFHQSILQNHHLHLQEYIIITWLSFGFLQSYYIHLLIFFSIFFRRIITSFLIKSTNVKGSEDFEGRPHNPINGSVEMPVTHIPDNGLRVPIRTPHSPSGKSGMFHL